MIDQARLDHWRSLSRRDDWHTLFVGSDIREMLAEIERLRIGQAVVAKQVRFYKPETPDFEFVRVPLGILRRALHCVPPPYPEDGDM